MNFNKQVEKEHYSFNRYFYSGRWMSYFYQIKIILELKPKSLLEVGPGTDLLKFMLNNHVSELDYKSLDIARDLNPDIVSSATKMPLEDNSFDVVCAFQVLEHLDYQDSLKALSEMTRVSKKFVLVSLPYSAAELSFSVKIPFLPRGQFFVRIPYPIKHFFDGQHYWELGRKGYSLKRVRKDFQKIIKIKNEFTPFENQYHRFYVLEK